MISDGLMIALSKIGFMAPDGRCKTFDASADGFGRGEGCSVIVLKRLADAIADGDRVLALIRGSAVNQDGHSTVLAAPNGLAQQAVIREALANAQLEPGRIGFVEAHGTGTALGDPIEVEALAATVGVAGPGASPCLLGAAKANIGHLEAAAGVTGVIKSVLVLQHEAIPPQVHFQALNPHISLAGSRFQIPTRLTPWPSGGQPRCIATSGFGVGGTNAHVILEEAPPLPAEAATDAPTGPFLLPLSAQSPAALRALAERWLDFLPEDAGRLSAACAAAGERRSHYDHRFAAVAGTADEMRVRLRSFLDQAPPSGWASGRRPEAGPARLAFVFGGQGQQWVGMGRELLSSEPVFRAALGDIDRRFRAHLPWSLLDELAAPAERSRLDQTEVAQPVIFAVQVALAAQWAAWGIAPDGVVGHSIGEIAALHVAGMLTLDDAVRIVAHRGRVMQRATGHGAMAAIGLDEAQRARTAARPTALGCRSRRSTVRAALSSPATWSALDEALRALEHRVRLVSAPAGQLCLPQRADGAAGERLSRGARQRHRRRCDGSPSIRPSAAACCRADQVDAGSLPTTCDSLCASPPRSMRCSPMGSRLSSRSAPILSSAARSRNAPPIATRRRCNWRRSGAAGQSVRVCCCRAPACTPRCVCPTGRASTVVLLTLSTSLSIRGSTSVTGCGNALRAPVSQVAPGLSESLGRRLPIAGSSVFEMRWPARRARVARRSSRRRPADHAGHGDARVSARWQPPRHSGTEDVEVTDFTVHQALVLDEADEATTTWQVVAQEPIDAEVAVSLHCSLDGAEASRWQKVAGARVRRVGPASRDDLHGRAGADR